MFTKLFEYLKYKKNRRAVKHEIIRLSAAILPAIRKATAESAAIAEFLNSDGNRLLEILRYVTQLSPEEIQKILVHTMTETMSGDEEI